jgi:hypothetical protein
MTPTAASSLMNICSVADQKKREGFTQEREIPLRCQRSG